MNYYDRTGATHLDGTRIFKTASDARSEHEVAAILERAWSCSLGEFGALSPIDWYAERDGRLVGLVEIKRRQHASARYPTVFLNVRKWLALQLGAVGLGCPAIYVVMFDDGLLWQPVGAIDAARPRIGGCMRIVKSVNDIEPVIEIPIETMKRLT